MDKNIISLIKKIKEYKPEIQYKTLNQIFGISYIDIGNILKDNCFEYNTDFFIHKKEDNFWYNENGAIYKNSYIRFVFRNNTNFITNKYFEKII